MPRVAPNRTPTGVQNPLDVRAGFYGQGVPAATQGYGAYGTIPQLPDPVQTGAFATQGNISNVGNIGTLGAGLTDISAKDALAQYQANLPNYMAMTGKASQNALSDLSGQVPPDVLNLIAQQAAERGVATGAPESANANAAYLRALGLTSLDLQGRGANELSTLVHNTPTGPQFNPSSMLVTPQQEQDAAAMQAIYNSAPNPQLAALEAQRLAQLGLNAGGGSIPPTVNQGGGGVTVPPRTPPPGPSEVAGGPLGTPTMPGATKTWINPDGTRTIIKPDGSVTKVNPDGTQTAGTTVGTATAPPGKGPAPGAWWNSPDPWGTLSNTDWLNMGPDTSPQASGPSDWAQFESDYWDLPPDTTGTATGTGQADWWNSYDPYSDLSGIDWANMGASDPAYDAALYGDYSGYLDDTPPPSWADSEAEYWYGDSP